MHMKIFMKKRNSGILLLIPFIILFTTARSLPHFGGKIFVENYSSKNIFLELYYLGRDGYEKKMIAVETTEILYFFTHSSIYYDKGNPNNFFHKIMLFDMDTGTMLSSINIDMDTFIHESGDILHHRAIFRFLIIDAMFQEFIYE